MTKDQFRRGVWLIFIRVASILASFYCILHMGDVLSFIWEKWSRTLIVSFFMIFRTYSRVCQSAMAALDREIRA